MTKHSHYHKDVEHLKTIDVYRTLELFGVTDQALGHAIKKLLCAGQRGAGKTFEQDVREAVDTLNRRLQMLAEDDAPKAVPPAAVRPNWATHMVLDGFGETYYVTAREGIEGCYVSLTPAGEVAHVFNGQNTVQIHELPPIVDRRQCEGDATHRDGGGSLYRQDTDGRWLRWGNDKWFTFSDDPKQVPERLRPVRLV